LYTTGDDTEATTQPFVHEVELKGKKGSKAKIKGLFDDGAMVNSICNKAFTALRNTLGALTTSRKTLRMADGTLVPSHGQWIGDVILGGHMVRGTFEVFPSGGGWSLLFGKPLLKQFKAVHDYETDTLMIPRDGVWTTIVNELGRAPKFTKTSESNARILKGDVESPSRQVLSSFLMNAVHVDKQTSLESHFEAKERYKSISTAKTKKRKGRRARDKLKQQPPSTRKWWGSVWTVRAETTVYDEPGELQPEVEVGGDHSLFTRTTDPHNPRRVAEILKQVTIGPDLSEDQQKQVQTLIAHYADCFALSVREVLPIPGVEHQIHVPPNVAFPKKVPHQRQHTEAQCAYLSDAIMNSKRQTSLNPYVPRM
jgi:hypothetical protein